MESARFQPGQLKAQQRTMERQLLGKRANKCAKMKCTEVISVRLQNIAIAPSIMFQANNQILLVSSSSTTTSIPYSHLQIEFTFWLQVNSKHGHVGLFCC